jgi:hypothetical protein
MFWVSYEPWGWVPYHYGSWDFAAGYGWVWYPGRYFRPAHVYWYWGSSYAGWIPSGYYNRHYGSYYGSRFGPYGGVYGYVGGSFGPYRHWVFSPLGRLGHRQQQRYVFNGRELSNRERTLGRGILTTDTRHLRPELWRRPTEALHTLRQAGGARAGRDLPDARPFVERVAKLPPTLERRALRDTDRATTPGRAVRADAADIESRSPRALPRQSGAQLERGGVRGADERAAREVPRVGADQTGDRLRQPETRSGRTGAVEPGGRAATPERTRTAPTIERPERVRPEARAGDEPSERAVRRPTAQDSRGDAAARRPTAAQRPTARPQERPTTARPQERTTIDRRDAARPTVQRPERQPTSRPQARPTSPTSRPQARPTPRPTSRPQARPTSPTSRPQARPTPRPTARPQARPTSPTSRPQARPAPRPSSSSRPQARPTSRPAPRPQARPAPRPSSPRPQARSAPRPSSPRPQARPASRPAPRPQARPSSGGGSRPATRPSSRSRPRPRPNG